MLLELSEEVKVEVEPENKKPEWITFLLDNFGLNQSKLEGVQNGYHQCSSVE